VQVNAAADGVELDRARHRPNTMVEHPVEVIQVRFFRLFFFG
jgi:hypothetical protein